MEKQQPTTTTVRAWLDSTSTIVTRALFPKVMEFKVICREREKHEFMPVVYVIDRSESWKTRVPAYIERELIQAYITPVVLGDCLQLRSRDEVDEIARATVKSTKLTQLAQELLQRTRLMDTAASGVCIDESKYKLGVLVDYSVSGGAREKADLYQVVRVIATTLRDATHKRALVVPVSMHYCSTGSFVNVKRYAGIRYGAPVLLEERDIDTFRVDPTEFVQHISARLSASLKMQPPSTAAQMEILRLSRTLHVYCAKVFRDDCFSRRQIASMNEEILQIHFRTRNHPDMHVLKGKMQKYCRILKKWRLRDEDINSAAIETQQPPKSPLYLMWLLASLLQRVVTAPAQLFVSGACDLIYRPPHTKAVVVTAAIASAVVKCTLALISIGVLVRVAQSTVAFWAFVFVLSFLLLLHVTKESLGYREVAQHLKKIQFYLMDAAELQELKKTRAVLARRIHALVAQYVITDLPPPVLQDRSKASADDTVLPNNDEYTLNPHHKIFINAPRSFPLAYVTAIKDPLVVRRVIHAPKMLRDETWRTIYDTLAPKHLRFSALLVDNKGDNLPMDALLQTPFFNAVLTAYVTYQNQHGSDDEHARAGDCEGATPMHAHEEDCEQQQSANCFGSFGSSQEVIDAALQLAQEEDELSS
uniref:Uncharacterized protein n=1 Tax=Globisporangium ultimum (strain ATCC 200006 / CBS 805.95 / DAOM BR144) TaxID=431595 RepID=K3WIK1_GLOUD